MVDRITPRAAIVRYFEETIPFYRSFWHGTTGALHFGLRGPSTRGHREELLRTNAVLADAAAIQPGERVLDAGCGVGGSSLWLARERGAAVIGVTISPSQARRAVAAARATGLSDRVQFRIEDYTRTSLPEASVDVFWALESACYAPSPASLLAEAARVLRPGGRLVVADGFRVREPSRGERALYRTFLTGLVLSDLATVDDFERAARECALEIECAESHRAEVVPSVRRLFRRCLASYPLAALARRLGAVSPGLLANSRSGLALYPLVRLGLLDYVLVVARKRSNRSGGPAAA